MGNDLARADARTQRGQRVFCSNRGQRRGCGRTFPMLLADHLPRHSITATWLWRWLLALLEGRSCKAATEQLRLPMALPTMTRLRRRLRHDLDRLRAMICRDRPAPRDSHLADPLLQSLEHLRQLFPKADCAVAAFQLHFQQPFLG